MEQEKLQGKDWREKFQELQNWLESDQIHLWRSSKGPDLWWSGVLGESSGGNALGDEGEVGGNVNGSMA
jgi:hypothetical protein